MKKSRYKNEFLIELIITVITFFSFSFVLISGEEFFGIEKELNERVVIILGIVLVLLIALTFFMYKRYQNVCKNKRPDGRNRVVTSLFLDVIEKWRKEQDKFGLTKTKIPTPGEK